MELQSPCTQDEFNTFYNYQRISSTIGISRNNYIQCNIVKNIISLFPIFDWLRFYNFKKDLVLDIQCGFTVAILQIPQGMGYAELGGVHPVVGIYMAILPVIVYFFMGTSRHISMGSFSIICLMSGKPVSEYSKTYSPIEVAAVVCLAVGLVQVLLGFCRVGSLSMFMSESLISGFTTGAAILVIVSQLQHVFGVKIKRHVGVFNVIYTIVDLYYVISNTNYLSLGISLSVIAVLMIYTEIVKPRLMCRYVFPIELGVLVIGIMISYLFDFKTKYSINIIGDVPTTLPLPSVPQVQLLPHVLVDSILIAVVGFSVQIAMASLFVLQDNYKIDPSQELIASGFANIFGAFFSCLPIGASLSRSLIQFSSGGRTQLASLFSSFILLLVILFFGKFLEPLPYAVLAGIVIKSVKGLLMQALDLQRIWKYSVYDGVVWLITCLSVVFLCAEIGLAIALVLSLLSIILLNQNVYVCLLGRVPNSNLYLEIQRYIVAEPVPNFIIIQIHAGLHFANIRLAVNKIEKLVNDCLPLDNNNFTIVVDMSTVTFVDPEALHILRNFIIKFKRKSINVVLTRITGRVYEEMKNCDFLKHLSDQEIFPSIEDAVSAYKR